MRYLLILLFSLFTIHSSHAAYLLIPMDEKQNEHLKAYGIAYWVLEHGVEVDWLLNYRGGSFAMKMTPEFEKECLIRGVDYNILANAQYNNILQEIAHPEANMDAVKLEKAPKIAVYSPKSAQPWDDAVTLVLTYAEIPYDVVYDDEVLRGDLPKYDWLHLHHEDFTGQYGKFYAAYRNQPWYHEQVREMEELAAKHGYQKVSHLKLGVAHKIRDFVAGGGFMFAMCSGADTYDIALAAEGVDICESMFDGDPADPNAQSKLDFSKTFAFKDFQLRTNPYEYEHSNIDANFGRNVPDKLDYFSIFEFSAKWDPIPTMLTQNHTRTVKGFMGQATAFRKSLVKSDVVVMGENKSAGEARYIHGEYGYGTWTFYGGHDPEDYRHFVGDPKTDLSLHPNSPGYRLILNNILFPAAKKQKQKT
ncbi:MAG: hypothetical protein WD334_01220 [Chitinophagales bacterium]